MDENLESSNSDSIHEIALRLVYSWEAVFDVDGIPYLFPNPISAYMKKRHRIPCVYQWLIREPNQKLVAYIGQADNLVQRVRGYLSPGPTQATNKRLNRHFRDCIERGCHVELKTLNIIKLDVWDSSYTNNELSDPLLRHLLERFLISDLHRQGIVILNR
jgi:hypothetical protein